MHYKLPSFHTDIRIQLISLSYHILVFLPYHFISLEEMFMSEKVYVNVNVT